MKLTHKGKQIAELNFVVSPTALIKAPEETAIVTHQENKITVIQRPTLLVDRKYSTCGNCGGDIWQAYERSDWASNVCDTCFPIIAPEEVMVQPMPQRQYTPPKYDYLPDGSVRTQLSDPGQTTYVSQCEPTRCGAITGALYVLGLWRDY